MAQVRSAECLPLLTLSRVGVYRISVRPARTARIAILIVRFVLLLTSIMPVSPLHAAEKIRISAITRIFLSARVAQHRDFFKDEGLDADIVVMGAAPSIAALTNGDIDFTLLTGTVNRAAAAGYPLAGERTDDQLARRSSGARGNQIGQRAEREKKRCGQLPGRGPGAGQSDPGVQRHLRTRNFDSCRWARTQADSPTCSRSLPTPSLPLRRRTSKGEKRARTVFGLRVSQLILSGIASTPNSSSKTANE